MASQGVRCFAMRGAVAEYEKAKIRERTERGRREKARQGKVVNPGTLPTWLKSDDSGVTVPFNPHGAEVVRLVFTLFVDERLPLRQVCARMHELGIATPSGRGTYWQATTLQKWLRDPSAKGTYLQLVYQTVPAKKPRTRPAHRAKTYVRDEAHAVAVPVPPVATDEVWQAAQRRLDENVGRSHRNAKRPYPLTGLLVCGGCGSHMAGLFKNHVKDPSKARYDRCGRGGEHRRVDGSAFCESPVYTKAGALERLVWDKAATLSPHPERLREEMARRRDVGSPTRDGLEVELRAARQRLAAIPAEIDPLVDGYGKGLIPDDAMQTRMPELQAEKATVAGWGREVGARVGCADVECAA